MGQIITVSDKGLPVYMGEGVGAGPAGRISYLDYVLNNLDKGITNAYVTEDIDSMEDVCDMLTEDATHRLANSYVWYEDGVLAKTVGVIGNEIAELMGKTIAKTIGKGVGDTLAAGAKAYFFARVRAYQKIFPEIIPLTEFTSVKYDILEAETRFGIKFKLASKWAEKINTRVSVKVYTRNKKPAFAIAYSTKSQDKTYNTEFVMIDSKYSKHVDYYTASAHTDIAVSHPSIARVLNKMKSDWQELKAQSDKVVKESVEEACATETFLEHRLNILDAFNAGVLTYEEADEYLDKMELVGIEVKDTSMFEAVDEFDLDE